MADSSREDTTNVGFDLLTYFVGGSAFADHGAGAAALLLLAAGTPESPIGGVGCWLATAVGIIGW